MKANRGAARRKDQEGEEAISNVVGAVLLFGILVLTLVSVRVEFVPVWDEDREARHMDRVFGQLAVLKSDLDRQVDNRTDVPITAPLTLGTGGGFRFFRSASLPATLSLQASSGDVAVQSPRLTIQESAGRSFYGLAGPGDWRVVDNIDDRLEDVTAIRALRVRIDMDPAVAYDHGDSTTLTVTDEDGAAGSVTITFQDFPSEQALETQVFDADGDEVSSDVEAFFQQTGLEYFYIDLLDPNLLFDAILGSATAPLELLLTDTGLDASYVVAYDVSTSGGTATLGSAGRVVEGYSELYAGGSLSIQSRNARFVDQTYVVEHGAILRVQEDGAAMAIPPLLSFASSEDALVIGWTLPSLTGGSQTLSGSRAVGVVADPTGARTDIRATAATLSFDIPTAYPAVWEGHIERLLRDEGLAEGDGFTAVADADSVLLTLEGPATDADVDDLFLSFKQASIDVEFTSG